ncbi:substrate-binding domain-containing protein [Spirabiliibacterium falconis]|uniref:substrate-binding domain-containing protein n=1 Tax=Spirabiliibacterium falconis TaxID=572023 RepID=UPI001AADB9EC|nr:substrate-binding domain-containing protein [Spirabiliibacterium falconis]MBE2893763.1 substrate-binding domain-containing protein [Spirabiliibacterium falconis]
MPTMKDIAKLAQVSTSTVSHVMNNTRYVSDEVRQKVLRVVQELNYTPSSLARSLKIKETNTIGMLVTASDNPFFSEMIRSVERYCQRNHYNLILSYTDGDTQRLSKNVDTLIRKQIDGLLLMCSESDWKIDEQLYQRLTLPIVIMDWWPTPLRADKIHENSEYGGYLATKTLIEHGHTHIAIITGNLNKSIALNRLQGYKTALCESGIALNHALILEGDFSVESGIKNMHTLLQQSPRPSAVFACSDTIAIGAYHAIWQAGLQVGKDISIIGYDDIHMTQYLTPPLSTIHQPKNTMAKNAVEILLDKINHPQRENRIIQFEPILVLRNSICQHK